MKTFTIKTTRFRFILASILVGAASWIGTFLLVSNLLAPA